MHPTDSMADSGIALRSLALSHPRADDLAHGPARHRARRRVQVRPAPPNLRAVFDTPRGPVTLESKGI